MPVFYHPFPVFFIPEEVFCHGREPDIDIGPALEHSQTTGIIGHEMGIQFVYQLVVVGFGVEYLIEDVEKDGLALVEKEVPRYLFVMGNKALEDFLVGHFIRVSNIISTLP